MPVLIFRSGSDRTQWWLETFRERAPEIEVRLWNEPGDVSEVTHALVWDPEPGILAKMPNLKLIISLGAGVDHLFRDPGVPVQVPIARVVDVNLTARMTEYIVLYVLRHHRHVPIYEARQREALWQSEPQPAASERTVGIMGLGTLGRDAAEKLVPLGFRVTGWTRTPREMDGVESFHGEEGLAPFLASAEILVNLLPLTPRTENIVDAGLLAALPEGAFFINVGRGPHVVDQDLIAALDSGRLSGTVLDVFRQEPLPSDHPFWSHPKVTLTPHVASMSDPRTVIEQVIENVRRTERGEEPMNRVDPDQQY
ncbi:MAG: glyoxylate/hydroxypyruvate reductase A [Rhodospirillaceae bacterium]|jgi:glyoxylate/hydroxypyruvate reductase|nr:glyoxylate/hydroxypyruvate reductase A [Rhodospirillaceae bacterium]MBT6116674.1 glyoxylate/hydroxypyruvate reductase A [Rhodospirillaceae bacterium]